MSRVCFAWQKHRPSCGALRTTPDEEPVVKENSTSSRTGTGGGRYFSSVRSSRNYAHDDRNDRAGWRCWLVSLTNRHSGGAGGGLLIRHTARISTRLRSPPRQPAPFAGLALVRVALQPRRPSGCETAESERCR